MSAIDFSLEIRQKSKANGLCFNLCDAPTNGSYPVHYESLIFFRFCLRHTEFAIW